MINSIDDTTGGTFKEVFPWTKSTLIKPNDWNILQVQAKGTKIEIRINDLYHEPLTTIIDRQGKTGKVGLVADIKGEQQMLIEVRRFELSEP